jgi:hypothetical protein
MVGAVRATVARHAPALSLPVTTDRVAAGRPPHDDPDILAATALVILVDEHPAQLSLHDLTRILGDGTDAWDQQDAVRVALRRLVADGLAHQRGTFYFRVEAVSLMAMTIDGQLNLTRASGLALRLARTGDRSGCACPPSFRRPTP